MDSVIILIVAIMLVLSQVIGPLTRSRHVQRFQSSPLTTSSAGGACYWINEAANTSVQAPEAAIPPGLRKNKAYDRCCGGYRRGTNRGFSEDTKRAEESCSGELVTH